MMYCVLLCSIVCSSSVPVCDDDIAMRQTQFKLLLCCFALNCKCSRFTYAWMIYVQDCVHTYYIRITVLFVGANLFTFYFLHCKRQKAKEHKFNFEYKVEYYRTVQCYKKTSQKKKSYVCFLRKMIYWHFRLYLCCVRLLNTNGIATYVWNLIKTNICGLKNFKYIYCGIKEA